MQMEPIVMPTPAHADLIALLENHAVGTRGTQTGAHGKPGWSGSDGDRGSVELTVGQALHVYAEGRRMDYAPAAADDPLRNEQDHFLACVRDRSCARALCWKCSTPVPSPKPN